MRILKIYSLNNFQICNIIFLVMLCIISVWPVYFTTGSLYLLTPLTHLAHSPPPTSRYSASSIGWGWLFVCSLRFTYKWNHTIFVFPFLTYFISIMPSVSIHVTNDIIFSFLWLNNILLCIYTPYLIYPFHLSVRSGFFPYLGYCK